MIKAILFDADGVVIPRHSYFSERLAADFGIPLEKTLPFFKGEFRACALGEADLKEEISGYLPGWGWQGSVDDLLRVWFEGESRLDVEVLRTVKELRGKGIKCCLVSDNEKYRAEYLMKEMGLQDLFDDAFFSCYLGFSKSQPEFFSAVIARLGLHPEEIAYWDDDPENVATAGGSGISAKVYESARQIGADTLK